MWEECGFVATYAGKNRVPKNMMNRYSENPTQNQAFIDGQNLYLGTTAGQEPWRVDLYVLLKIRKVTLILI